MNDGRIVAADVQFFINAGNTVDESLLVCLLIFVYSSGVSYKRKTLIVLSQVAEKMVAHLDNAYNIPNLRGRSAACRTNLPSNTAFRGFGVPQCILVLENMIDSVATLLGRPADQVRPVRIKRQN